MAVTLEIVRLDHARDIDLPKRGTPNSAGVDLYAAISQPIIMTQNEVSIVPVGISIALPDGFEAQIRPRSGLAAKFGVTVLNTPGTIDSDYRGELKVILINHGGKDFTVERGMRIGQMVVTRYEEVVFKEVSFLDKTFRGNKGLGSTGV